MEIDKRGLPNPENTSGPEVTDEAGEETPKNQVEPTLKEAQQPEDKAHAELEALKIKNLELQKQKEHWREKYERDISKPAPSVEMPDEEYLSDEAKALKNEILSVKQELVSFKKEKEEQALLVKYPQLKDKQEEFKEFLENPEHSGLPYEKSAKLFMLEAGMLVPTPERKGLERPTGGQKGAPATGISEADVKRLRETQPRQYIEMLRKGTLKPEDIT